MTEDMEKKCEEYTELFIDELHAQLIHDKDHLSNIRTAYVCGFKVAVELMEAEINQLKATQAELVSHLLGFVRFHEAQCGYTKEFPFCSCSDVKRIAREALSTLNKSEEKQTW